MNRCRLAVPAGHPIWEYPDQIQATLPLDDRFGHRVKHDQPFVSVLVPRALMSVTKIRRYEKGADVDLRN